MAKELREWSVTDASNNFAAPDGFPEGQLAGTLNNCGRAIMGVIARHYSDNNGSLATGGTSTALTVTLNSQHSAWFDGLCFAARITTTCGATPTINPTGSAALGAKSLYWAASGVQVTTDDLQSGAVAMFMYELTSDKVYVFGAPQAVAAASETVAGKAELATQAETNTGTDDARIVTPLKLTNWTPGVGTVTAVASDKVLLADTSAAGVLKQALISDINALTPSNLVVIERKTSSAVASYDFSTGISSTYRTYILEGWLQPATDDVELWLRTGQGAGFEAGASDYKYSFAGVNAGASGARASNGDTKIIIAGYAAAAQAVGNDADQLVHITIKFNAPSSSALQKLFHFKAGHEATDDSAWQTESGTGCRNSANAITQVQLLFESGNIAAGDVTLYGVANA